MTIQDKLDIGLTALGWKRDESDRSRYHAFTNLKFPDTKVFTGSHGAFRKGVNATHSVDISGRATYLKAMEAFEQAVKQLS